MAAPRDKIQRQRPRMLGLSRIARACAASEIFPRPYRPRQRGAIPLKLLRRARDLQRLRAPAVSPSRRWPRDATRFGDSILECRAFRKSCTRTLPAKSSQDRIGKDSGRHCRGSTATSSNTGGGAYVTSPGGNTLLTVDVAALPRFPLPPRGRHDVNVLSSSRAGRPPPLLRTLPPHCPPPRGRRDDSSEGRPR